MPPLFQRPTLFVYDLQIASTIQHKGVGECTVCRIDALDPSEHESVPPISLGLMYE